MRSLVIAAIVLSTGCEDPQIGKIDPVLVVTPEHIDFGTVELGQPKVEIVVLKNIENVDAVIQDITIESDCEDCFLELNQPPFVGPFVEYNLEKSKAAAGELGLAARLVDPAWQLSADRSPEPRRGFA